MSSLLRQKFLRARSAVEDHASSGLMENPATRCRPECGECGEAISECRIELLRNSVAVSGLPRGRLSALLLIVYCKLGADCVCPPPATTLAADVVSHQIWGPRRKSWGIEMTLLSSIMRGMSRYSHLTDIVSSSVEPRPRRLLMLTLRKPSACS